jgi:hypothetical protein
MAHVDALFLPLRRLKGVIGLMSLQVFVEFACLLSRCRSLMVIRSDELLNTRSSCWNNTGLGA